MAFLRDLQLYLESADRASELEPYVPDLAMHQRTLHSYFQRLEQRGATTLELVSQTRLWAERLPGFVTALGMALSESAHGDREALARQIDVAIARELGFVEESTGSRARDAEIDRLRDENALFNRFDTSRYALEISAVRRDGKRRRRTEIGKLLLELPDRDAIRLMLSSELAQASGLPDDIRLSFDDVARLLGGPLERFSSRSGAYLERTRKHRRLTQLGLADRLVLNEVQESYPLTPLGQELLRELVDGSPFAELAKALVADETAKSLAVFRAVDAIAADTAAQATNRTMRLVLHELRNALLPVRDRFAIVVSTGEDVGVSEHRGAIERGLARALEFLDTMSKTTAAAETGEVFALSRAIESAVREVASEIDVVETTTASAPMQGPERRFELVLLNILRNAAQSASGRKVRVWITAARQNGDVEVLIDDDGPGVPDADRERVFDDGYSTRPDGSGRGLALAREVVQTEMRGAIRCEASPRGGARFVLRLPIARTSP